MSGELFLSSEPADHVLTADAKTLSEDKAECPDGQ
jgi:hypothetical protein